MTELLTAAQMRAIEEAAMASGGVTGQELMERAGRGVVEAIMARRPELARTSHRAVILCGPGNNGGDGFVVARLLKERGWEVEIFLYGDEAKLPPDAAENARRWREMGGIDALAEDLQFERVIGAPKETVIVDALFGTGLGRPLEGFLGSFVRRIAETPLGDRGMVVSVDLPSGICSDSGRMLGAAIRSELTVSFHLPKRGHHLDRGPEHSGDVAVADIGLRHSWPHPLTGVSLSLGDERCEVASKALFPRRPTRHKYDHGHALILSGGVGKGGAARLAARGALRIGAGLVTVGCPPAALIENAARLDAIMLRSLAGAEALTKALADERISALCLGPGFGVGDRMREMVSATLAAKRATALDADALTSFAEDPAALFRQLHETCVLTPHEGEFGRLFPDILAKLKAAAVIGPALSKVDATREAAARAGCVVLFKGADTVIAAPDGRCAINSAQYDRSAPWLATAGSGDVLAGFITGLLARSFKPMEAARAAASLHVECALKFGPGLIAEDLPEQLPAVFRDLAL